MEKEKKEIEQPNKEEQRLYNGIISNEKEYVSVRGKKWGLRYLHNGTKRKLTELMLSVSEKMKDGKSDLDTESKIVCKSAAIMWLNGKFKIMFFYWLVWRWFYYIKEYTDTDLLPFIALGKKKVGAEAYYIAITLLTGMMDTMMTMTRQEVEHIQAVQLGAAHGHSAKSITESQNQEPSSSDSTK